MNNVILYIDPGTGAMLFSVIMGVIGAAYFVLQKAFIKLKFILTAGKVKENTQNAYQYVIYSDDKRYWNVFGPICDEFERRKVQCEYWTASKDDPAFEKEFEYVHSKFIGEGNKAYATLNFLRADICLSTTPGLNVYQWKRSENVKHYVHITHEMYELVMYRMFGIDYYDAVLYAGSMYEKGIREIESLRNIKRKELVSVGSVYLDSMLKRVNQKKECIDEDQEEIVTVLFAPTWGESSTLNRYGNRILYALKDTGYNIVVRPHPQSYVSDPKLMEELMNEFPEGNTFHWNRDNDNFDVLSKADILISDFSSVVFDYTFIFNKPIIYVNTNLDYSPYDAAWLDRPIWNISVLPELGAELTADNIENIKQVIDGVIDNPKYCFGIEKARDYCWEHRGEAATRVVDYLISKRGTLC